MLILDNLNLNLGTQNFMFDGVCATQQCTAVMGASGAGKTTLLNTLAGFIKPNAGDILWQGQSLLDQNPAQRPFTTIFQEQNLFAHLTVLNNVALGIHPGLSLRPQDRELIQKVLEDVGLGGMEKRMPASLSGGQQQRVALARALLRASVRKKPWLLLDEPFSALDPGLRQEISHLFMQVKDTYALSILLVSHEPKDALKMAQEVIFIANYGLYWQGKVDDFLHNQDPLIQSYLGHF